MRLHHTAPPNPPQSGYITLLTPLRTYRRYLQIDNTHLVYGHRPDKILFTTDLSRCELSITGKQLKLRLPGRRLVFSLSRPEMHVWYPHFAAGTANLQRFYSLGASLCTLCSASVFAGSDRADGSAVRVWRTPLPVGWHSPGLRIRCHRVVRVRDLFVTCDDVHVVFEEFGGLRVCDVAESEVMRFVVKDILGVLSILHGRGLMHGDVKEATFVRDGRAVVVVFGFVEKGPSGTDLSDVAQLVERICQSSKGAERVVAKLRANVPALEVMKDEWLSGGEDFEEVEDGLLSQGNGSNKVDSPRSVLSLGIPENDR